VSPQRKALIVIIIAWILGIAMFNALALTPVERKKVQLALDAVNEGIEHGKLLQAAAEQARIEASNANSVAMMAASSAMSTGLKAKSALDEAERCQKENERMRPIVDAVTGPWWFPGGKALIYGAKKSLLSLVVILVGGFVLFLIIKIVLTVVSGGTWSAGLGAVTGIFGALGRWFARAAKRLLSFFRRRGERAVDNIRHRTIGDDDHD
jgi:hypothetical protein